MRVSRAGFLKTCVALLAGRGLNPLSLFAVSGLPVAATGLVPAPGVFKLADASATDFLPHLHSEWTVGVAEAAPVRVRLEEVTEPRVDGGFEQFSVTFKAAGGPSLSQDTYAVQHPATGAMDLFLVPIGHPDARSYQACFSRRVNRE